MVVNFIWKALLKPILFLLDPERAHHFSLEGLRLLCRITFFRKAITNIFTTKYNKPVEAFGLTFTNQVGLAAGLDKNGDFIEELSCFGFSHIEIGTITPLPQEGNPKPRLFRLQKDKALINRMGFNNKGIEGVLLNLRKLKKPRGLILGINIGKNKNTPNDKAWEDYLKCFTALHSYADYFTINISSPNTPGLRELQDKEPLEILLNKITEANNLLSKPKPILLKIAPDLQEEQLKEIVELVLFYKLNGIILGNTTVSRKCLSTNIEGIEKIGSGGLSGAPLFDLSTDRLKTLKDLTGLKIAVIGVGGIMTRKQAKIKLQEGAKLIQIYSGFVYNGPGFVKSILKYLNKLT